MSRKELLELLQRRCAELGVDLRFSTLAPAVEELEPGLRPGPRRGRPELRRPAALRRRLPAQPGRPQVNKYMWLGTDQVFEAFKFFVKDTEHGVMQIHGYPYSDEGCTFIVEMHEDVWRTCRLRRHRTPGLPAGRMRRGGRRRDPCALRRRNLTATRSWPTTPSGSTSPRSATSPGATATSCSSATPPTPRTSPSAPAPSWPWRTPSRWRPACTNTPSGGRAGGLRS